MRGGPEHDARYEELPAGIRAKLRDWDRNLLVMGRVLSMPPTEHWYWVGGMNRAGAGRGCYGRTSVAGRRSQYVHRVVFELLVGAIPQGFVIDHLCGETLCCRPSHLEATTIQENTRRGTPTAITGGIRVVELEEWGACYQDPLPWGETA